MDNSTTRFSLCTWIKKRFTGSSYPVVLENVKNIILGDTGYYNYVAGTNPDLRSKYNRTLGTWFHVCMTWSNEDRRTRIYLDGHLIETSTLGTWFHVCLTWSNEDSRTRIYLDGHLINTSGVTEREELDGGREMCLGNDARNAKFSKYVFGGDLFKLNIYNRVLTESEIKNIASDICSREEEELASIKVLSWEYVISNERSGNVSEIPMRCEVSIMCRLEEIEKDLDKSKNKTLHLKIQQDEINCAVLERLQNLEEELAESQNKTSQLEEKLLGKL